MLTKTQKKTIKEIDQIISEFGLDYKSVESYEKEAILPVLRQIKDQYIRGQIISDYTLIDDLLATIICSYFFGKNKSLIQHWRTKKFKNFNYFILEKLYLGQKLDLVKNIIKVPKRIDSDIRKLNDLRNALAHAFFPENLRGKRLLYKGVNIRSLAGVKKYLEDERDIVSFLFEKAYGLDISDMDFRV